MEHDPAAARILPEDCVSRRVQDLAEPYMGGEIRERQGECEAKIRWDDGTTTFNSVYGVHFKIVND